MQADDLLDDAIRHDDPGGWLRVAIEPDADGGTVRLIVETGKAGEGGGVATDRRRGG